MLVIKGELCVRKDQLSKVASSMESVLVYCNYYSWLSLSTSQIQITRVSFIVSGFSFLNVWDQNVPILFELSCKQSPISASFIVCGLIPNDHFLSIHCVQSSKKTARILCKPCLCVFSWSLSRELHPTHIPSSTLGSLVGGSPSAHLTECTCLLPLQLPMCKCPLTPPMPRVEGWVSGQLISTLVLWLFFSPPLKGRHTPFP